MNLEDMMLREIIQSKTHCGTTAPGSGVFTASAWVAVVARVLSLAQEPPQATDVTKKNQKL